MSLTQSEKNRQIVPASSDPALVSPTHRVERAAGEFRRGVPVLIRPPAGGLSLTAAAETVGDQTLRLMTASAGAGSLMITHDRAATLKIPLYTEGVISIPLAGDVTAESVRAIADPAADLDYPLKGPFHVSREQPQASGISAVRLAKLAGLLPAAVAFSVTPEQAARLAADHGLTEVATDDIDLFPQRTAWELQLVTRATVPLQGAEQAELAAFRPA